MDDGANGAPSTTFALADDGDGLRDRLREADAQSLERIRARVTSRLEASVAKLNSVEAQIEAAREAVREERMWLKALDAVLLEAAPAPSAAAHVVETQPVAMTLAQRLPAGPHHAAPLYRRAHYPHILLVMSAGIERRAAIARALALKPNTVGEALKALEREGLAARLASEGAHGLTDAGRQRVGELVHEATGATV
jgi:ABC-type glutathione transport system ATPase component